MKQIRFSNIFQKKEKENGSAYFYRTSCWPQQSRFAKNTIIASENLAAYFVRKG
jgi:hypothetical protein